MSKIDHGDVSGAARVAATLRTVLKGFTEGGPKAAPLLVGEVDGGQPQAVLLPYELFQRMIAALEEAEEADIAATVAERLATPAAEAAGLDTEQLAALVAAGHSQQEASELLRAAEPDARD